MTGGKKKKFFGDPDWWMNPKKEWQEVILNNSDPLTRPGMGHPGSNGWGS